MARDPAEGVLPLCAAATAAYEQVFSVRPKPPSGDELDLIALVLAGQLPIYGVRAAGQEASPISGEELLDGVFWGGAKHFELGHDIDAVTQLVVRKSDLERVLDELKRKPLKL
jgi:hypothetical protein